MSRNYLIVMFSKVLGYSDRSLVNYWELLADNDTNEI